MICPERLFMLAMASKGWPCAAARVSDPPDDSEKSVEPAMTAFIAPTPAM